MGYVFFGGMRGTAWVNTFQTLLFLGFGAIAVRRDRLGMGGFGRGRGDRWPRPQALPAHARAHLAADFFSYTFIPLSSIAFPHIAIFCLTARSMTQFKRTVILYPLCIMAIWLPCVFLGVMANRAPTCPGRRQARGAPGPGPRRRSLAPAERDAAAPGRRATTCCCCCSSATRPIWLAGLLGAGIMAAVMATDSQILALSTMFTEDVFAHYGGNARFGEAAQVHTGRAFVVGLTVVRT